MVASPSKAVAVPDHDSHGLATVNQQQSVSPFSVTAGLAMENVALAIEAVQKLQKAILKRGQDYDTVGNDRGQPSLHKPGAEKLLLYFGFAVSDVTIIESTVDPTYQWPKMSDSDEGSVGYFDYTLQLTITQVGTGRVVGVGIGSANTREGRYVRTKWVDRNKIITGYQNPFTLKNTIWKMAKKRALVDAALTCTASSWVFTQDLEDFRDDELPNVDTGASRVKMQRTAAQAPEPPAVANQPIDPSFWPPEGVPVQLEFRKVVEARGQGNRPYYRMDVTYRPEGKAVQNGTLSCWHMDSTAEFMGNNPTSFTGKLWVILKLGKKGYWNLEEYTVEPPPPDFEKGKVTVETPAKKPARKTAVKKTAMTDEEKYAAEEEAARREGE